VVVWPSDRPGKGRVNCPEPHSSVTSFERRREAALHMHMGGEVETRYSNRVKQRSLQNHSSAVRDALADDGDTSSPLPKRHGPIHVADDMSSDRVSRALRWDSRPATSGAPEETRHAMPRGERFVREQLAGVGAAERSGHFPGVAARWTGVSSDEAVAGKLQHAGAMPRGERYVRENLSGEGAAREMFGTGADDKPVSSSPRRGTYVARELTGVEAAKRLPGALVSRLDWTPEEGKERPAVARLSDLSARDLQAAKEGRPRSHWETEASSLFQGNKAGWYCPNPTANHTSRRQQTPRGQEERFKSTALW
jgi:hypothetical protein